MCVHLSQCGFKCLVLDVCLRVNLQSSMFVQDLFYFLRPIVTFYMISIVIVNE